MDEIMHDQEAIHMNTKIHVERVSRVEESPSCVIVPTGSRAAVSLDILRVVVGAMYFLSIPVSTRIKGEPGNSGVLATGGAALEAL